MFPSLESTEKKSNSFPARIGDLGILGVLSVKGQQRRARGEDSNLVPELRGHRHQGLEEKGLFGSGKTHDIVYGGGGIDRFRSSVLSSVSTLIG